jgi:hypothetical protein
MGGDHEARGMEGMWGRQIWYGFKATTGTYWCKEMTNVNLKTLAVGLFLFFAAITPAITYGGVYQTLTDNQFGAVEMILATAWCGIFYALFAGQPIMINGATTPVVAYVSILVRLAASWDVPFLTLNAWVGIWTCGFLLLSAFLDLDRFVQYTTRFSDEIFALLISVILIFDAIGNPASGNGVLMYFRGDHISHARWEATDENYSAMSTALLSTILTFGTTGLAFVMRAFKGGPFCYSPAVRSLLADFALVTSIVLWTFIDNTAFASVQTDRLNVPDSFAPTLNCCNEMCSTAWPAQCPEQAEPWGRRSWIVPLFNTNGKSWLPVAAAGPAVLGFILVFLNDGITWHLMNHPSHKLTHGDAMTYDTCLIAIMSAVNGILGLPLVVASTVSCVNHLHALSTKDSKENIIKVQQTRLTGILIHALMCVSLFMLPLLKMIPVPVLLGVFLFMGLASLGTNQLFGRVLMFFMQPSKYPKHPYTEHMAKKRMHLFTCIQLVLFAGLYVIIATKVVAIMFPFYILMCIPIRLFVLPKIFTDAELLFVDADEDAINEFLTNQRMHASTARLFHSAKLHGVDAKEITKDVEDPTATADFSDGSDNDNVAWPTTMSKHRSFSCRSPPLFVNSLE